MQQSQKLTKLKEERIKLYSEYESIQARIKTLETHNTVLKDILCRCKGQSKADDSSNQPYPLIVGTGNTRISVLRLGELPTENINEFHGSTFILPINFLMRRKYLPYLGMLTNKEKVVYLCEITQEDKFLIKAEDGKIWKGTDFFKEFRKSFSEFDFATPEDFFGFNNVTLQQHVESLGDISIFENYLPIKSRKEKRSQG